MRKDNSARPQDLGSYAEWLGNFARETTDNALVNQGDSLLRKARTTEGIAVLLVRHELAGGDKVKLRTAWKPVWSKYSGLGVEWPAWLQTRYSAALWLR